MNGKKQYNKMLYNEYYNALTTFKINRKVKQIFIIELKKTRVSMQDFFDDCMREYVKKNSKIILPEKIRKVIKKL